VCVCENVHVSLGLCKARPWQWIPTDGEADKCLSLILDLASVQAGALELEQVIATVVAISLPSAAADFCGSCVGRMSTKAVAESSRMARKYLLCHLRALVL
jgi:hypothetical protein